MRQMFISGSMQLCTARTREHSATRENDAKIPAWNRHSGAFEMCNALEREKSITRISMDCAGSKLKNQKLVEWINVVTAKWKKWDGGG